MFTLILVLFSCRADKGDSLLDDSAAHDSAADDSAADTADSGVHGDDSGPDSGDTGEDRWAKLRLRVGKDLRASMATGASVAVSLNGEIIFAEGFGTAVPDESVEVTPDTLFNIGSDTKKITSIAVLQQVEAGRLSMSDTLADALPGLEFDSDPDLSGKITLQHLLTHTTSLNDDTHFYGLSADDDGLSDYAFGDYGKAAYAMAEPGAMWNYSNPNFSLAGLATETAGGEPWGDLVEKGIFEPLGMTHSFTRLSEVESQPDVAIGYGILNADALDGVGLLDSLSFEAEVGKQPLSDFPDSSWVRPAGGVWSTPSDMCALGWFLIQGDDDVLSDASREAISTYAVSQYPGVDLIGYGYGLWVYRAVSWTDGWHEIPFWVHGGNHLAYTSTFYMMPEQGIVVSILSNGYGDGFNDSMVEAMLVALDGQTLPNLIDTPDLSGETTGLEKYAGAWYEPTALGTMILTVEDDHLAVSLPDVEALGYTVSSELEAAYPGVFLLSIDGYQMDLSFVAREGEEEPTWAANRSVVFTREDDVMSRPPPPPRTSGALLSVL